MRAARPAIPGAQLEQAGRAVGQPGPAAGKPARSRGVPCTGLNQPGLCGAQRACPSSGKPRSGSGAGSLATLASEPWGAILNLNK